MICYFIFRLNLKLTIKNHVNYIFNNVLIFYIKLTYAIKKSQLSNFMNDSKRVLFAKWMLKNRIDLKNYFISSDEGHNI